MVYTVYSIYIIFFSWSIVYTFARPMIYDDRHTSITTPKIKFIVIL